MCVCPLLGPGITLDSNWFKALHFNQISRNNSPHKQDKPNVQVFDQSVNGDSTIY